MTRASRMYRAASTGSHSGLSRSLVPTMPAEERIRIFRLAWDFAGSALASRNEQYERFYLASSPRNLARHLVFTDRSRADRLVDRFLKEPY